MTETTTTSEVQHDIEANIATARELIDGGHSTAAAAAAWLHAQLPGTFKDEAEAIAAICNIPVTDPPAA
jgi:hypothetical protein